MSENNIFSALAKYNSPIDENYLTESFVFVIKNLLKREPSIGIELLNNLCVNNSEFSFSESENIFVSTQVVTEQGTPDIKISSPEKLIYIEVKLESDLGDRQIERYKEALASASASIKHKHLILLTRYSVDFKNEDETPYKHIRWFEVYNRFEGVKDKVKDTISCYLIEQLMSFLEVNQMSIQKVGWEYINGVPALFNLMKMIEEIFQKEQLRPSARGISKSYTGFYSGDGEFWCGISNDEHLFLLFEFQKSTKYDFQALKASYGDSVRENENNNICFCLPLEKIHFFSLDKEKQFEEISKFVRTACAEAKKMRLPS